MKGKEKVDQAVMQMIASMLTQIYSNKSSDEYKQSGDITKSAEYTNVKRMTYELSSLRNFPEKEAREIKTLFTTLHLPIFKRLVAEYIAEPNERNTAFTAVYTVGYRILVGELSRVFTSTLASKDGLVYKPDRISRKESMAELIRYFNEDLEKRIEKDLQSVTQESALALGVAKAGKLVSDTFNTGCWIFQTIWGKFNPISLIGASLSSSYNMKVKKLDDITQLYLETKDAYEQYKKIPSSQQSEKVLAKYPKLIEKYNIKMQNLAAKIEHYDQRAVEEARDKAKAKSKAPVAPKPSAPKKEDTDDDDDGF
jgi:hypothetical protein